VAAAAEEEGTAEDEQDSGSEGGGGRGASPGTAAAAPGPGSRWPAFRINRLVRQRWLFRKALVRALLLLQQQHLEATGGETASEAHQAGSRAGRQPRRGATAAKPAGSIALLRQWHPSFDPTAVTAPELAAAGEQLAAPGRATALAAAQEAAEADALAAARRLAAGSSHGRQSSAAAAAAPGGSSQRATARPPQLMKQHAPCTDSTQASPRASAFLPSLRRRKRAPPFIAQRPCDITHSVRQMYQHAAMACPQLK
jgi:hypothetical protein